MQQQPSREAFIALRDVADASYFALVAAEKASAPAPELARLASAAHRAHRAVWALGYRSGSPENNGWRQAADKFRAQARELLKAGTPAGR